jgi:D-alanyl-lipoteichoic acid acyltransferase DltB (MBOAT superfamily)
MHHPVTLSRSTVMRYAMRFGICMLTMEFLLHAMHVVAIKDSKAWAHAGPADLALIGFWNLMIVWLKVSVRYLLFMRERT